MKNSLLIGAVCLIAGIAIGLALNGRLPSKQSLPLACEYKGKTYKYNEGFKDDCNTCSCQKGGEVVCTLIACN